MISLEFKNWLILEAERIPLNQVDDSCKTTCPNSTVIWLITLEENWQQYKNLLPAFDKMSLKMFGGTMEIEEYRNIRKISGSFALMGLIIFCKSVKSAS
jgi:hypothetical protein